MAEAESKAAQAAAQALVQASMAYPDRLEVIFKHRQEITALSVADLGKFIAAITAAMSGCGNGCNGCAGAAPLTATPKM
jgi:hypothetical protein